MTLTEEGRALAPNRARRAGHARIDADYAGNYACPPRKPSRRAGAGAFTACAGGTTDRLEKAWDEVVENAQADELARAETQGNVLAWRVHGEMT